MVSTRVRLMIVTVCLATSFARAQPLNLDADYLAQREALIRQMADRQWCADVADQVADPAALIAAPDRDPADVVIRRAGALLDHLTRQGGVDLSDETKQLESLRQRAANVSLDKAAERQALYLEACHLRRRITLANPLLNFDKLLFLTRHRPMRGDHHMVDQYYGFNAKPGGGVCVLENPFSDQPVVRDLLADVKVTAGRLAGRTLTGGSFNTLELNYDAESIAFAWSECGTVSDDADWSDQPWSRQRAIDNHKPYYYWSPTTVFHVFRAKLDGSELAQLTDGAFNEFDPCFLPDGRIAFISERRGGFLRCGGNRPNPTYTLYRMNGDGANIEPLSYHETQEWNPSVDRHGMLVYTRWDYIDRDNDGAHHMWTCYPDGRDPRAWHGNYPLKRETRPWMELSIRAIPESNRLVAVAAPHHGYNYGSLVRIDPQLPDDGAMSQLQRITPESHFPEAEKAPGKPHDRGQHNPAGEVYGSPWPLDESFYLCVYDPDPAQRHHGIYLVDVFGNRELIWRDPAIECVDPMPLRPRKRPPVIPDQVKPADQSASATVTVMNVYDADFDWPADTKIKALRIVQLFPKTTFHMHEPRIGAAGESLGRGVVGTVPVESDGSAYFEAPVGVPLYFQALDERGRAVQSMRSDTYLHPGESLTCQGCHEPKREAHAPLKISAMPLALRREPSKIKPAVDGAWPLSYPRLVQPVLDRQCVECHQKNPKSPDLTGAIDKNGWSKSYLSLAPFAWKLVGANGSIVVNGSRSEAGRLGARASKLITLLEAGHYETKLTEDEMHRLVLWLDTNANFFGVYHDLKQQGCGEIVKPVLQ